MPKEITTSQTKNNPPLYDPYFVETRDTFSTRGPRSITRNILQDKTGNLWFATWEGIVRYDGKLFTNVTLKEGLIHFHVFSVLEEKNGTLWFGTIGGGVYRYNPSAQTKAGEKSYTLFTTKDGLASNFIGCMLEDKSGNIWFGTEPGVSRYNGHTFENFTVQEGLGSNSVNSIIQDKTGKIWFGTRGGVRCYDGKSFSNFENKEDISFYNVRSIIEDKTGNIWIGGEDGLYRFDGKSLTNITKNFTGFIFEDHQGNIWLSEGQATGPGMTLSRYDGKNFSKIKSDSQIFGVTEDKAGNIWFGTVKGVSRYDGKSIDDFSEGLK